MKMKERWLKIESFTHFHQGEVNDIDLSIDAVRARAAVPSRHGSGLG